MSIGGSKSSQKSTSTSNSSTQGEGFDYGTGLWSGQSPYLSALYAQGYGALGGANGAGMDYFGAAGAANSAADVSLMDQRRQAGLANQDLNQSNGQLMASTEALYQGLGRLGESNAALRQFLNPGVNPALQAYSQNLGQQFNEQFLTGLKGDAAIAGGLGGSRQQIGAALGSQRAAQTLSDFAANLYGADQDRAMQAAQAIGNLNQGYAQNAAGFANNAATAGDIANQRVNIGSAFAQNAAGWQGLSQNQQGMYDLARQMPWYNLSQYAGLLGMPITLDQGGYNWNNSQTTSTSKGSGGSAGFSFGLKS